MSSSTRPITIGFFDFVGSSMRRMLASLAKSDKRFCGECERVCA
jgi:hypothetical protein